MVVTLQMMIHRKSPHQMGTLWDCTSGINTWKTKQIRTICAVFVSDKIKMEFYFLTLSQHLTCLAYFDLNLNHSPQAQLYLGGPCTPALWSFNLDSNLVSYKQPGWSHFNISFKWVMRCWCKASCLLKWREHLLFGHTCFHSSECVTMCFFNLLAQWNFLLHLGHVWSPSECYCMCCLRVATLLKRRPQPGCR